ncbi:MAG: hypothetical protein A3K60_07090 [Euryarchaeota archaeon RBG_19FT_COMBO_56_21]|nr:MAG: hypothetical protein A3K60_07090 [Euryarchaeota archaeon RBG_19FT_COMBO_56_21]
MAAYVDAEAMESAPGTEPPIPEILLAAAVVSISPSFLWIILGDMHFAVGAVYWSFFPSIILSVAYLHINPNQGSCRSNTASGAETEPGRWYVTFIKYDWILLAYGIVFAMSFAVFLLPYLVWWAFLPFHSVMVMAITIRRTNVKPRTNYRLRVALSILFCLGAISWSYYAGSHFYLT